MKRLFHLLALAMPWIIVWVAIVETDSGCSRISVRCTI